MTAERIGGFQGEGIYTQRISRMTEGQDGKKGWYPPQPGQTIVTPKGPFKVEEVLEFFKGPNGGWYFTARGSLVNKK
ncbi:MAG: hypothetical protein ACPLKP_03095 [Microgenomates group bacterium]